MSGFGLVTQPNTQAFVPFNSSVAPFASDCESSSGCFLSSDSKRFVANLAPQTPFATNDQQIDAYQQWMQSRLCFILLLRD